ncbi:hypothetical protein PG997_002073 [Apiospora hydei]|uniref:Uncharacterized protein n=1 Tax=Apiospora hydei TaxID=1337664 RepID=A0ABR1X8D3_9PEZI
MRPLVLLCNIGAHSGHEAPSLLLELAVVVVGRALTYGVVLQVLSSRVVHRNPESEYELSRGALVAHIRCQFVGPYRHQTASCTIQSPLSVLEASLPLPSSGSNEAALLALHIKRTGLSRWVAIPDHGTVGPGLDPNVGIGGAEDKFLLGCSTCRRGLRLHSEGVSGLSTVVVEVNVGQNQPARVPVDEESRFDAYLDTREEMNG